MYSILTQLDHTLRHEDEKLVVKLDQYKKFLPIYYGILSREATWQGNYQRSLTRSVFAI